MALRRPSLKSWFRYAFDRFLDACSQGLGKVLALAKGRLVRTPSFQTRKRKPDYNPSIEGLEQRFLPANNFSLEASTLGVVENYTYASLKIIDA